MEKKEGRRKHIRGRVVWAIVFAVALTLALILIRIGYAHKWTGFSEQTLWDWLSSLQSKHALKAQDVQKERELEVGKRHAQDTALRTLGRHLALIRGPPARPGCAHAPVLLRGRRPRTHALLASRRPREHPHQQRYRKLGNAHAGRDHRQRDRAPRPPPAPLRAPQPRTGRRGNGQGLIREPTGTSPPARSGPSSRRRGEGARVPLRAPRPSGPSLRPCGWTPLSSLRRK